MITILSRMPALEPLRYPGFRALLAVSAINQVAMLGGGVALGWFVLRLTDSVFMVGLVLALRMLPNLFFGIPAGAIADVADRRRMIQVLNLLMALPMGALGLLIMSGRVELWEVFALSFVGGALKPFNQTALASLAFDITGSAGIVYGLTLMRLAAGAGGLVGSIVIGSVMARVGVDAAFFVLAGTYLLAALTALLIRSRGQAAPTTRGSVRESMKGFAKEIRTNRSLLALTMSTSLLELMGFSHSVLMPSIVRDVLGMDAEGLGLITGLRNLGALIGVFVIATIGNRLWKGLVYQISILLFGCLLITLSFAGHFATVAIILIALSAMMTLTDVLSQSLMQLVVPNVMRGRAMGSWMLATGTAPAGNLQIGAVASAAGIAFALSLSGLGLVFLAIGLFVLVPSMRKA